SSEITVTGIAITSKPLNFKIFQDSSINKERGLKCCADSREITLSIERFAKGNAKEVLLMNEIPFISYGFDITPGFSNARQTALDDVASCWQLIFTQNICGLNTFFQRTAGAAKPLPTSTSLLEESSSAILPTIMQSLD